MTFSQAVTCAVQGSWAAHSHLDKVVSYLLTTIQSHIIGLNSKPRSSVMKLLHMQMSGILQPCQPVPREKYGEGEGKYHTCPAGITGMI